MESRLCLTAHRLYSDWLKGHRPSKLWQNETKSHDLGPFLMSQSERVGCSDTCLTSRGAVAQLWFLLC